MERRLLSAFILSFVVLVLWQMVFPQPKTQPQGEKGAVFSQMLENKELVLKPQNQTPITSEEKVAFEQAQPAAKKALEEKISIQNDKLEVVFSTYGGSIIEAKIREYDTSLPVRDVFGLNNFQDLVYRVSQKGADEVVFVAQSKGLEIRKIYKISDGEFMVHADMQVTNISNTSLALSPDIQMMMIDVGMAGNELEKNGRDRNLFEYSVFTGEKVVRKTGAYKFSDKDTKTESVPVEWFGFRNRYYCAIFKPNFSINGYKTDKISEKELTMTALLNDTTLNSRETTSYSASIYFGPQKNDVLKSYGMDMEKIQVYFRYGFFDAIAKIIEDLIKLVHKFVPNWGASILLVSLVIYFSFYPLTMKSMLSMRKMQSLQPKITELREKYEKNPQKLNQEIMKVYSENKVNPLGGCLPLLLQMPIFICLYQMIWRSILFKNAGFLWIKDLSEPDRLMILTKSFPVIGNEINILPFIIIVLMILQQRLSSKNMNVTDPNQLAQQKMMTFMLPAFLFLVFYRIASGLTLYFTVFYVVSLFTQLHISKKLKA